MPNAKLTDAAVRALVKEPATGDKSITDPACTGLRLRLRPSRSASWEHVFMVDGKSHRYALGSYPEVSLAEARESVENNRRRLREGIIPISPTAAGKAARKEAAATKARTMAFSELFSLWHGLELVHLRDSGKSIEEHFKRHVLPKIGDTSIDEVTRGRVMEVLDAIKRKGSLRVANIVLQHVKRVFDFAVLREFVDANPASIILRKDAGGRELPRERFLNENEIMLLSAALPDSGLEPHIQAAVWVILSTLVRVGALYEAKWSDIDLELDIRNPVWRVWDEKKRVKVLYEVPLTRFAQRHLRAIRNEQRRRDVTSVWVMHSPDDPREHAIADGLNDQLRDRQGVSELKGRAFNTKLQLPGGRWTPHDIRRTGSSRMKALGVPAEVRRACMNHKPLDKLEETYDREEIPMRVRRQAFEKLAQNLESLIAKAGAGK